MCAGGVQGDRNYAEGVTYHTQEKKISSGPLIYQYSLTFFSFIEYHRYSFDEM